MVRRCRSKGLTRVEVLVALAGVFALVLLPVACRRSKSVVISAEIDSKNLLQTAVVATLDCPLPEHKNAIWCSTFQMAWDKLKQDIIREPIQIPAAQELADRLNRSQFPTGSIEERSYYAVAGFVNEGIVKQVQKDMKQRFPSEPAPTFDSRYWTLPDAILAYAYLNVDAAFQFPYYADPNRFDFQDSNGTHTGVTAFCTQSAVGSWGYQNVRDQVEIVHYDDSQPPDALEFAVDPSKRTQPYQIILARIRPQRTLGEAAKALQKKIDAFRNDQDYEVLRKLRLIDTLVVPDVACKLTHHFDELLRGDLANRGWSLYRISEAMQRIEFTLNRTGMTLKSEARMRPATRSASQLAKPRHLHFDRPFLICVKKREPNATPFFLMWVDNTELMQPYEDSGKSG